MNFTRYVVGGAISKTSSLLMSLDERLNREEEAVAEEDAEAEVAALGPGVDEALRDRFEKIILQNKKLERLVRTLETALDEEQRVSAETSAKLAVTVTDRETIDGLVDEYSKLSSEAGSQAERDAAQVSALLNKNEEVETRLRHYERQIIDLTDGQAEALKKFVKDGGSADAARVFASLQQTKARNLELELEMEDLKKRVRRSSEARPHGGTLEDGGGESSSSSSSSALVAGLEEQLRRAREELADASEAVEAAEVKVATSEARATEAEKAAAAADAERAAAAAAAASRDDDSIALLAAVRAELAEAREAGKTVRGELQAALEDKAALEEAASAATRAATAEVEAALSALSKERCEALEQSSAAQVQDLKDRLAREAAEHEGALEDAMVALEAATVAQDASEKTRAAAMETLKTTHAATVGALESKYAALVESVETQVEDRSRRAVDDAIAATARRFEAELRAADRRAMDAERKATEERARRRDLHNRVIELQGNIRVVARCRPPGSSARTDDPRMQQSAVRFKDEGGLAGDGEEIIHVRRSFDLEDDYASFEFDAVYAPGSTQAQVFEAVRGLVTSVLDGYSVCIFAYGQTGSGKTHTMEGPPRDRGVNFRAIASIFNQAAATEGTTYDLDMSVLEIYNETIRDLLRGPHEEVKKLEIQTATGACVVPGLNKHPVRDADDVERLIAQAATVRTVGAHNMNAHSSRSHCILTLHVTATAADGRRTTSKLHLIDLAGSERLAKTDASGDRLKEAQAINKSLSALGDVIAALSSNKKGSHVPYRNSKLTFFLQDSLSGDSKALMFVNVSPQPSDASETLCSLKFAARCRDCALGRAKKNTAQPAPRAMNKTPTPPRSTSSSSRAASTPAAKPTGGTPDFSF